MYMYYMPSVMHFSALVLFMHWFIFSWSTEFNHNALFVRTEHGGHLGYFEGGVARPKDVSWVDRLLLQYADACIELSADEKLNLSL